jgi:uncharacterized short protein YbdD (DUF466 family)
MRDNARDGTLSLLGKLLATVRKLAGMPDYAAYTEHLRRCHPQLPIPSERQFFDDFVRTRYEDGPTRCC